MACRKLSPADVTKLAVRYRKGETAESLGAAFGVTGVTALRWLRREGVSVRPRTGHYRPYSCNTRFFQTIDCETKSYWLGFLAADANVTPSGRLAVRLAVQDTEHLTSFVKAIESTHPVKSYNYSYGAFSSVEISSVEMAADLATYGVTPQKTFSLRLPDDLPPRFVRDFVRGYVDGDGGFYTGQLARGGEHYKFAVTSNQRMVEDLQSLISTACGIHETKLEYRRKGSPVATLNWSGKSQVLKIAQFLYNGATIFLPRKRDKVPW